MGNGPEFIRNVAASSYSGLKSETSLAAWSAVKKFLFESNSRASDQAMKRALAANNGKDKKKPKFVRNFEHVDGNWPSHVYLDG
jgi:hypothetical protein